MQSNYSERSTAVWARGIATLWAVLAAAAGSSALAAPTETVLYSFTGGSDGNSPRAGLIADSSGNLYGTTKFGGGSGCGGFGCGVVCKLSPSGTETVLYSFTGGNDGRSPVGDLIADSSGNLYGTTAQGGESASGCLFNGCGVVFKLTGSGFAPAIPFTAFGPKLGIQFGPTPNHDRLQLQSSFTLGAPATGSIPPPSR